MQINNDNNFLIFVYDIFLILIEPVKRITHIIDISLEKKVYIVQVYVKVKENDVNQFINASRENAENSLREDGIVRFDVLQDIEDPQKFLLTEVYKDEKAPLEHKKSPHYKKWKETVAEMMAEPRHSVKYRNIYPVNNMD